MRETDENGRWIAEDLGILHANPWFSVKLYAVRQPNGGKCTYYTIHHEHPAVGIVGRDGDRFLLIRQFRFIIDQFVWAIPSGGVHPGESPQEAAVRELREETGVNALNIRHLVTYFPTYGCSDQRFELFVADIADENSEEFDRTEVIETRWFTKQEILKMITENKIVDGLSLVPLLQIMLLDSL